MVTPLVQRMYTRVLEHIVEHGWAPHYTDLAVEFGISTEEARVAINEAAEFAVASLASAALFWTVLGGVGGLLFDRFGPARP